MPYLVEPAKSEALDKVGEGRPASYIAAGWMQTKLSPKAAGGDESVTKPRL